MKIETQKNIIIGAFALLAGSIIWVGLIKEMYQRGLLTADQFNYYLFRPIEFFSALEEGKFENKDEIQTVWAECEEVKVFELPEKKSA